MSLMQADAALCVEARMIHGELARGYARRIVAAQRAAGAANTFAAA